MYTQCGDCECGLPWWGYLLGDIEPLHEQADYFGEENDWIYKEEEGVLDTIKSWKQPTIEAAAKDAGQPVRM